MTLHFTCLLNLFVGRGKKMYVKGLACGLWDAWWPFFFLDLLSRGAGGEAVCEGSLDK